MVLQGLSWPGAPWRDAGEVPVMTQRYLRRTDEAQRREGWGLRGLAGAARSLLVAEVGCLPAAHRGPAAAGQIGPWKVLHCWVEPPFRPRVNQSTRWREVPWVKLSGTA